jgi:hypothetical protein
MFADSVARSKELKFTYRSFLRTAVIDKENVLDQLRIPLAIFKRRLAEACIQRTLAISHDTLVLQGGAWFGIERQRKHLDVIEKNPLRVSMIIAGFIGHFPFFVSYGMES